MPFFVGPITPNAAMLELCVSMLWLSEKVCRDVYRQGTVKSACKKRGGERLGRKDRLGGQNVVSSPLSLGAGRVRGGELTTFVPTCTSKFGKSSQVCIVDSIITPIELQARFWGQNIWIKCRETGCRSD